MVLHATAQAVVREELGVVVLIEVVEARLPVERAVQLRFQAHFLRDLIERGDGIGRLARERDEARAVRQAAEPAAEAAIDIAAAVRIHRFVAGDRVQRQVAEIPAQPHAAAEDVQLLLVGAVEGDGAVRIEVIDQVVAAGLDDVGAEQPRGAVQVAHVRVEQRAEIVARSYCNCTRAARSL